MKKLVLILGIVFVTMSSFTTLDYFNCEQSCANWATLSAHITGGDFDYEADIFEDCVNTYCNQQ